LLERDAQAGSADRGGMQNGKASDAELLSRVQATQKAEGVSA
jgi:hypothetical protein